MHKDKVAPSHKEEEIICLPGLSLGSLLQIKFEGLGEARTSLIGMEAGSFIIVRTPPITDISTKLYQKNHAILRYLYNGSVYGFRATLLELIRKPLNFAIFSYPGKLEQINLRRHERVSCRLVAEMSIEDKLYRGWLTDISEGGCSFEFIKAAGEIGPQAGVDEAVTLTIYFSNIAPTVSTAVVRVTQTHSERIITGVRFTKTGIGAIDAKIEAAIKNYILEHC